MVCSERKKVFLIQFYVIGYAKKAEGNVMKILGQEMKQTSIYLEVSKTQPEAINVFYVLM